MLEKTTLPPIGDLFKESWEEFKKSLLNLFFLFLIALAVSFVVAIALIMIFFLFGMSSLLFTPGGMQNMFSSPLTIIGFVLGIVVAVVAMVMVGLVFQIATIRLVYNPEKKQSLKELLKTSYAYVWPVFIVSFVTALLTIGGYGLLLIPGIVFSLLFSFSAYEVLFNNQRGLNALRRSYALFSTNFWGIFGRLALFTLITIVISFVMPKENGMGILSTIINVLISWFGLCYSIILYKQVAKGNEHLPGKSITGIAIASAIGLVLLFLFTSTAIKLVGPYINTFLTASKEERQQMMMKDMDDPENYNEMPSQEEMDQMLKQLPQGESMQIEDQSI